MKKGNDNNSIDFQVDGGKKLHGKIATNFSKNGSVGLLCASLLNKGTTTLHGIARIEEVNRVIEILESIGVSVKWKDTNTVVLKQPKKLTFDLECPFLNYRLQERIETLLDNSNFSPKLNLWQIMWLILVFIPWIFFPFHNPC